MALANYNDLIDSVKSWLHRSDMDNIIPDLIALAEARISRDLYIQPLEKSATITTSNGNDAYSFPSDMVSLIRMYISDPSGHTYILQGYDPSTYRYNIAPQMSKYYYIEADSLKLSPIPDGEYTVTIIYRGEVPSLQANTTNTIMTKYPNIYLFGTLSQAAPYTKDDKHVEMWEQKYQQAIKEANDAEDFRNHNLLTTEAYLMLPRRAYDIRTI